MKIPERGSLVDFLTIEILLEILFTTLDLSSQLGAYNHSAMAIPSWESGNHSFPTQTAFESGLPLIYTVIEFLIKPSFEEFWHYIRFRQERNNEKIIK